MGRAQIYALVTYTNIILPGKQYKHTLMLLCSSFQESAFLTWRRRLLIKHWPAGVKKGWSKLQCVIQACLSRFRLVFVSVSLLFTQTIAIATLFAPERRLWTPARLSHHVARWSRRDLDWWNTSLYYTPSGSPCSPNPFQTDLSQRILRSSGITECISDWAKCFVDSKVKWVLVHLMRQAGSILRLLPWSWREMRPSRSLLRLVSSTSIQLHFEYGHCLFRPAPTATRPGHHPDSKRFSGSI